MFVYLGNPKRPINKFVKTGDGVVLTFEWHTNEHSKVTDYKANIPQSTLFLYNNKQLDNIILETNTTYNNIKNTFSYKFNKICTRS